MTLRLRFRFRGSYGFALALATACAAAPLGAQQLIGYVSTSGAEVLGASDVLNGQAVLIGSASVTARESAVPITLGRGGTVRVCQASQLHVTESKSSATDAPLLFSLDHGALEIQMKGTLNDSIMTPDLRFTVVNAGPLDLRVRVASDGDTCVENRGVTAPTLDISDPFGETMYQVSAGQHVLFERGSLRDVVDHETDSCGCPAEKAPSVADALLASGGGTSLGAGTPAKAAAAPQVVTPVTPVVTPPPAPEQADLQTAEQTAAQAAIKAAEAHPFPAAISEGRAPTAEIVPAAPGAPHVQITDTLTYNAALPAPRAGSPAPAAKAKEKKAKPAKVVAAAKPAAGPASPPVYDVVHIVGRMFKRLFG